MSEFVSIAMERVEKLSENVSSKVHKADNGTYSWPVDEMSVVLYPLNHFSGNEELGVLSTTVEDSELCITSFYLFRQEGLVKCITSASSVHEVYSEEHNPLHSAAMAITNDPTDGTPNDYDVLLFQKVLTYC